jgi:hypothetical protein
MKMWKRFLQDVLDDDDFYNEDHCAASNDLLLLLPPTQDDRSPRFRLSESGCEYQAGESHFTNICPNNQAKTNI